MMKIHILAFGIAKDILGNSQAVLEVSEGTTIAGLKDILTATYPDFSRLRSLRIALNEEYQDDSRVLVAEDEVVIIPPVSGG
ncbi:MAG: MoaD/ThiS family protein [Saprospiraceae bacterium]|jgi:molybdopterin converting factor subunit 1